MTFISVLAVALGFSLAGLGSRAAHAQQPSRAPVAQVAFVEALPTRGARAEIVRFPAGARPPLILLDAHAVTRRDVVAALLALEHARSRPVPRSGTVARLTLMTADDAGDHSSALSARADRILRALRAAPQVRIGNLGIGRWIELDDAR